MLFSLSLTLILPILLLFFISIYSDYKHICPEEEQLPTVTAVAALWDGLKTFVMLGIIRYPIIISSFAANSLLSMQGRN